MVRLGHCLKVNSHELSSSGILAQLSVKLPYRFQQEWSSVICGLQPKPPTISEFSDWLNKKVRSEQFRNPLALMSSTQTIQKPDGRSQPRGNKTGRDRGVVYATSQSPTSQSQQAKVAECSSCKGPHELTHLTHRLTHPAEWRIVKILMMKRAVSWCRQTFHQFCAGSYRSKEKLFSISVCSVAQNKLGTGSPMFRRCCAVSSIFRFGVPLRRTLQRLNELFERMLRHYQA